MRFKNKYIMNYNMDYEDFDIIIVGTSTSFKFYEQIKQEKLNDVTSKIFFVKPDVISDKR